MAETDDRVMDFAGLLARANASKTGRNAGQWTPAAVEAWRAAAAKLARLLDAAFALELKIGRKVSVDDEDRVGAKLAKMEAATAAVRTKAAVSRQS